MLSVYTRHHPDCKNAGAKTWRRCSCPKWIWGSLKGKFIRQSARTHLWEQAEGKVEGRTIQCPWQGSRFNLKDGCVVNGPAVHGQRCLEVRVSDGQVELRRRMP